MNFDDRLKLPDCVASVWTMEQIVPGSASSFIPGLGAFVTLTSSGIKPEGEPVTTLYDLRRDAWGAFNASLALFAGGRNVVFFRSPPKDVFQNGGFYVTARLLCVHADSLMEALE